MRVAFLDIDGVLNSERMMQELEDKHRVNGCASPPCVCFGVIRMMDIKAVARLNRILNETGAKVVISSTWRKIMEPGEVERVLIEHGFVGEVIGETPDLVNDTEWLEANRWGKEAYERIDRGHEIQEWLVRNPSVDEFVILDDDSDMAHLRPYLVLTDRTIGLDDPDVERAIHLMPTSASLRLQSAIVRNKG